MAECGWSSRCRWDRGKENIGAIIEQIDHYYDPATPSTLHRGSAITVSLCLLLFLFTFSAPLLTDPTFTFVFYMCVRERVLRTVGLNISGGMYENKLSMVSDLPFKSLKKKVCSTATQSMTCFAFSVCSYPWFKKLLTISERCGTTTSSSVHGMFFTRHASCCREMHIHM